MEIDIKEKGTGQSIDHPWLSAGQLKELTVSPTILSRANVRMDRLESTHADTDTSNTTPTSATVATLATADTTTGSSSSKAMDKTSASTKYLVEFLGMTTGNVTFLGFMKDPSVAWIFFGCMVIIAGTLIAFMFVYREVWCYYDEQNKLLYMATSVRGTSPSAHREFDRLIEEIKRTSPTPDQ